MPPFRIRRESDGAVFEYDNPVAVPQGFVQMNSPLAATEAPPDLRRSATGVLQSGLAKSDKFFETAREGTRQMLQTDKLGDAAWLGDALNPVPGNTAEAAAMAVTAPLKGNLIMGPLKRIAAAGATGAAVRGVQGEDPVEAGTRFALGQAISEGPGAVVGGVLKQRQLSRANKDVIAKKKLNETITEQGTKYDKRKHEISEATRKSQYDAMTEQTMAAYKQAVQQADISYKAALAETKAAEHALNLDAQKQAKILDAGDLIVHEANKARLKADFVKAQQAQAQAFEAMKRAHAQQGAAQIMNEYKQKNPAWADLPSDETGLLDAVKGRGPQLASARFEASFKEAMAKAKGKTITLSPQDAQALGLPLPPPPAGSAAVPFAAPSWMSPQVAAQYQVGGSGQSMTFAADKVMEAMLGKSGSQATRGAYRRAASALDAADIGDPVARAEYKSSMAMIEGIEKAKAVEGGQYHPDRMLKHLTAGTHKDINIIRNRGEGDALRGPLAETTKNIPQPPSPLTPPTMPDKPLPRQVQPQTLREPAPGTYPPEPNIAPFQPQPAPQPRPPMPDPQLPQGFQAVSIPVPQLVQRHPGVTSGLAQGAGRAVGVDPANARLGLLAALTLGNQPFALRAPQSTLGALGERGLFTLLGGSIRSGMGDRVEDPWTEDEP
jgi:hypothetical protein